MTDPRTPFIRELIVEATSSSSESLVGDDTLKIALEIERIASEDSYFTSRNLCANVDLFLSFIYKALYVLYCYHYAPFIAPSI